MIRLAIGIIFVMGISACQRTEHDCHSLRVIVHEAHHNLFTNPNMNKEIWRGLYHDLTRQIVKSESIICDDNFRVWCGWDGTGSMQIRSVVKYPHELIGSYSDRLHPISIVVQKEEALDCAQYRCLSSGD